MIGNSFFFYTALFALTFIGGLFPILKKEWKTDHLRLLLTFSAAFLLGITFLHLIPDSVGVIGPYAGLLVFVGFFVQQLVQKVTHGVEHGHHSSHHSHHSENCHHHLHHHGNESLLFWPIFWGLSFHAFSEGLPLGIHYVHPGTLPSLILAIGLHKIPEAMLIIALFLANGHSRKKALMLLLLFSLITPISGMMADFLGNKYQLIDKILTWCIPFVAGVFIQIATTIFYENSSHSHSLNLKKWLMVLLGGGLAAITLL